MGNQKMEQDLKAHMEHKKILAKEIVTFPKGKEQGLTFEKAEKILRDTIEVLQKESRRREM